MPSIRENRVKFAHKEREGFGDVVKREVNSYFTINNVSQLSNGRMYFKSIVMLLLYFVPFFIMVTGLASKNIYFFYILWALMGVGIVGIGANIMHDSNHGSYVKNKKLNILFGDILNLLGGYSVNWRIQHNILHHTYTNLNGLDEDIEGGKYVRLSPDKPLYKFHRYQHIYAWFLYAIMNLYWALAKDFINIYKYNKNGLLTNQKATLGKALLHLAVIKIVYFFYVLVLPIMFAGVSWYHIVLGFVIMHFISGFSLACIFQPAHVVSSSQFPSPNSEHKIENSWAVHQMLNTADFAPNNKFVCWFIGGLNFQVEHHLFPHICHVHYPKIAPIVRRVAQQFNVPYHVMPTFRNAIYEHYKMLKKLGQPVNN